MASIEAIRNSVNSSSVDPGTTPSPKTKKLQLPERRQESSTSSSPASKEIVKQVIKKTENDERIELYRKIRSYLKSKHLKKHLPDDVEPPKENASLESLKSTYAYLTSHLKESSKRIIVDQLFDQMLTYSEVGCVQFLKQHEKIGMAKFLSEQKEELFMPELEEIMIELSDSWVPSAQTRLMMKLMKAMSEFSNQKGQNVAPAAPKALPPKSSPKKGSPPS